MASAEANAALKQSNKREDKEPKQVKDSGLPGLLIAVAMASSIAGYAAWALRGLFSRRKEQQREDEEPDVCSRMQRSPGQTEAGNAAAAANNAEATPLPPRELASESKEPNSLEYIEDGYKTVQRQPTSYMSSKRSPAKQPMQTQAQRANRQPQHSRMQSATPASLSQRAAAAPVHDSSDATLGRLLLLVLEAGQDGCSVWLDSASSTQWLTFGRGVTSDIAVPFTDVSVKHCQLFVSASLPTQQLQAPPQQQQQHQRTSSNVLDGMPEQYRPAPGGKAQSTAEAEACWYAADVGSLNGTCINGESLERCGRRRSVPRAIAPGDCLRLGERNGSHEVELHEAIVPSPHLCRRQGTHSPAGPAGSLVKMEWAAACAPSRSKAPHCEDVYVCNGKLKGVDNCSMFAVLDGHGGSEAAKQASQCLPWRMSEAIIEEGKHGGDWSFRAMVSAFANVDHDVTSGNTGSTLTAVLVWYEKDSMYVRCANIGDSDCAMGTPDGSSMGMETHLLSTCHKVSDKSESQRLETAGQSTNSTGSRVMGLNLGRVLGDKTLKEHCPAIIAEPSVSDIHEIPESGAVVLAATDGVWDMMSSRRALAVCSVSGRVERMAHHIVRFAISAGSTDDTTAIAIRLSPQAMSAVQPSESHV